MTNRRPMTQAGAPADIGKDLEAGAQRQAAVVEIRDLCRHAARRPRHVDQRALRVSPVRHAEARQAGLRDAEAAERGHADRPIPSRDEVAFDKLSSVFVSNTNHEEDQPVHLRLTDPSIPIEKTCRSMASRRGSIARRASMRSSMATRRRRPIRASSSTRRIACTARPATSRTRRRTSPGPRRRAAADRIIRTCDARCGGAHAPPRCGGQ